MAVCGCTGSVLCGCSGHDYPEPPVPPEPPIEVKPNYSHVTINEDWSTEPSGVSVDIQPGVLIVDSVRYVISGDSLIIDGTYRYNGTYTGQNSGPFAYITYDGRTYTTKFIRKAPGGNGIFRTPATVDSVSDRAFSGCRGLTVIALPEGLDYIGESVFEGCESLRQVDLSHLRSIGTHAFKDCVSLEEVSIPESVEYLGSHIFESCRSLKKCKVGVRQDNFGDRGHYLFSNCTSLTDVSLPEDWWNIPEGMFYGCSSLSNLALPAGITHLGRDSFAGTSFNGPFPDGIEFFGEKCFRNLRCSEFKIPGTVYHLGSYCFAFSQIIRMDIPESVDYLGSRCFIRCPNLEEISFPNHIGYLSDDILGDCKMLKKIHLPTELKEIGWHALNGCSSLETIEFPESVRTFGEEALYACGSLKSITLLSPTPPTMKGYLGSGFVVYVKKSCLQAYQASPWGKQFLIRPLPDN